jgi:predicted amino acid racemase
MLLDKTLERNPGLLEAAIELHQNGIIPAATHVIDLDAVAENASVMAEAAERSGLRVFVMTKQDGHEPHMTRIALDRGLHAVVAVEAIQAHRIHRYGFPLGHVGHLSNVPRHQIPAILAMEPEFITVYSYDAAKAVSDVAREMGREQSLYVVATNYGDEGTYDEMIGGWTEETCVEGVRPLLDLPNVSVAGLTQHVTIDYVSQDDARTAKPTAGFFTTLRAKEKLEKEFGLSDLRINCAGNANALTMPILASYGATDVEPGAALTGSAKFHAIQDMPEKPAHVFVSEATHIWRGDALAVGGGFSFVWDMDETPERFRGLFGRTFEEAKANQLVFKGPPWVDFHGVFKCDGAQEPKFGDTVLFCHLTQAFVERGYVAAVSGVSAGKPELRGLFDNATSMLDEDFNPVPLADALASIERVSRDYRP